MSRDPKYEKKKPHLDSRIFFFWVLVSMVSCVIRAGWAFPPKSEQYYTSKEASRILLSIFMIASSCMRLNADVVDNLLCPIVPPPLPPKMCVYASGFVEVLGAALLLTPDHKDVGGLVIVALLWGVFPANIYHAISTRAQIATGINRGVYLRLGIQFLFLGWAGWHAGEFYLGQYQLV